MTTHSRQPSAGRDDSSVRAEHPQVTLPERERLLLLQHPGRGEGKGGVAGEIRIVYAALNPRIFVPVGFLN